MPAAVTHCTSRRAGARAGRAQPRLRRAGGGAGAGPLAHAGTRPLKGPAAAITVDGQAVRPRVDIPAKVTGGAAYVQDLRLPGMLHARVVRPPRRGARSLARLDDQRRRGPCRAWWRWCGTAATSPCWPTGEWQAITAMRALAGRRGQWSGGGAACRSRRRSSTPSARLPARGHRDPGPQAPQPPALPAPHAVGAVSVGPTGCTARSGRPARWRSCRTA